MRSDQIDSYRRTLETQVRELREDEAGVWIVLDDSVFYPTAGGQPHDTGVLSHAAGEARVVDVVGPHGAGESGTETVLHRIEGAAPAVGDAVRAEIDWDRRYRHMQRHSAQHLLSQAFLHIGRAFETRSVALGSPDATLDLAGDPDDAATAAAFELARSWAYANLEIEAFEVDESEVASYPLRRPPKVSGRIRLVRMGEVELSACGGTHLRSTAEALPLLALGRQRIRGELTRVTFRAGLEAGERAAATVALADELARSFSARWDELPERVEALREERARALGEAADARADWAEALVRGAMGGEAPQVLRIQIGDAARPADAARLAALAEAASRLAPSSVALLAAVGEERVSLLFQAGPEVLDGSDPNLSDLRPALKAALELVAGRGGGKPGRVQGAGERPGRAAEALDAAEAMLTSPA